MREVVLIFEDNGNLADFLIEADLNSSEVCSLTSSIKSVMSAETIEMALAKYRALKYDVLAWKRLQEQKIT